MAITNYKLKGKHCTKEKSDAAIKIKTFKHLIVKGLWAQKILTPRPKFFPLVEVGDL